MGDFLVTDPYEGGAHGFLVVGWGPFEHCEDAMSGYRYTLDDFTETRIADNTTPYVVDFTRKQSPTARPFYCSMYNDQIAPITDRFNRHNWYFYILKNQITLNTSQLYVDSNWTWDATTGQLNP